MTVRSKTLVCGRSPAEIVDSNPTGSMDVCFECCVLSDRDLCNELITRPEESYRLWCVVVRDLEKHIPRVEEGQDPLGGYHTKRRKIEVIYNNLGTLTFVVSLIY